MIEVQYTEQEGWFIGCLGWLDGSDVSLAACVLFVTNSDLFLSYITSHELHKTECNYFIPKHDLFLHLAFHFGVLT